MEARLGAVVPRGQLPEEPALAQLPVDPVIAREGILAARPRDAAEAPAEAPSEGRKFPRASLPDVSFVEDEHDRAPDRPAERVRTKRTS